MVTMASCSCGYVGPAVAEGLRSVCPICRSAIGAAASPPAPEAAIEGVPDFSSAGADPRSLDLRKTFRIPCPNGHVNVTPAHMLGTQVVCPRCNAFYVLQMVDSLEYREVAEREARRREEEVAKKWLSRAIYAAIFIGISLIGMIVFSLLGQ